MAPDRAHAVDEVVTVVLSPAEQAVVNALSNATTQVNQSIDASNAASTVISTAQTEASQAVAAGSAITVAVSEVNTAVSAINTAITAVTNATGVDQSSQLVQDAKTTVTAASTELSQVSPIITNAMQQVNEANTARAAVTIAMNTASTEFSQANASISDAQTVVDALQATISTVREVLPNTDDAGVQMILPFSMQMGGTNYNQVFVGSNATITFGTNEGWVYYDTPNAASVSVGGLDWTTWSYGSGITYATTGTTLDISWDLRVYPTTDSSIQMTQLRFNADVNPTTGAWVANVSGLGPNVDWARWNYRQTANGTITQIQDTSNPALANTFSGTISQGNYIAPAVDPNANNATVQARVDAANATIAQLNQTMSGVVAVNSANQQAVNQIPSINSVNTIINNASNTVNTLRSTISTKSMQLTDAINNNIPTPAPILAEPIIEGTTVTISPELPQGYEANTWYYQVITDDANALNPYEGQTLNTDGAPSSIQLTGLTEGATYTIRVANWSGPVSSYTETVISIPAPQSSNLTSGGASEPPAIEPPAEEPPAEEPPTEEPPAEEPPTEEPPAEEPPTEEPPAEEPPTEEPPAPAEEAPLTVEEIISVVEDLVTDGNLTAADAEAVLDALMADGEITSSEVNNLSDALTADGTFTLAEKSLVADALISAADGEPVTASDIAAAGLEYRDLPPEIPVEVRADANGNPVVITAEVASALLTLESPAALVGAIAGCFNPEEAIEGLTEEQKCEVFLALASIGADMSTQERQKAKEVLVAAVLVGQIIVGSAMIRRR